jgi:hypothetical protein
MKRKRKTKAHLRIHFKRQALRRYGVTLNRKSVRILREQIQNGESVFINKESNSRTLHVVEWEGIRMPVIYDNKRNGITTALPRHVLKYCDRVIERRTHE